MHRPTLIARQFRQDPSLFDEKTIDAALREAVTRALLSSAVQRATINRQRGFFHDLMQRWVGMTDTRDVFTTS